MNTYIVRCKCKKIVRAKSEEYAVTQIYDLCGYNSKAMEIYGQDLLILHTQEVCILMKSLYIICFFNSMTQDEETTEISAYSEEQARYLAPCDPASIIDVEKTVSHCYEFQ